MYQPEIGRSLKKRFKHDWSVVSTNSALMPLTVLFSETSGEIKRSHIRRGVRTDSPLVAEAGHQRQRSHPSDNAP